MKKAFGEYRWLAGRGRYGGSLWLGGDHLLVIEDSGFVLPFRETYRRIDYKNIQAISYAPTKTGLALTIFMTVLLAFLAWGILANMSDLPGAAIFFGILAVPIVIALIAHLARGATCACQLQTAVQVLKLRPINRIRIARRALAEIEPLCRAHQSGLALEPPTSHALAEAATPPGTSQQAASTISPPNPPPQIAFKPPWPGSPFVTTSLAITALSGAVGAGELFVKGMSYYLLNVTLSVASIVLIIASAARITRFRAPPALKWSIWGNIALCIIGLLVGYGMMMVSLIQSIAKAGRGSTPTQLSIWSEMANADMSTYGSFGWVLVGMSISAILLSLMGLPAAQSRVPPPTPVPEPAPPSSAPPGQPTA